MGEKLFLAGASGVIGRAVAPLLIEAGYVVYGSTRNEDKARKLETIGVKPVVIDVFDLAALTQALIEIAPTVVMHQLTDLPPGLDATKMVQAVNRNARIRDEGTRNLVLAARAAGCVRVIAQSIAWAYAQGQQPYVENSPLDISAEGIRSISVGGVVALENWTLNTPGIIGTVLRYGQLYGPGTGRDAPAGASPLHIEAAANATLLATQRNIVGIFNITENNPEVSNAKVMAALNWSPEMRLRP